jgi:hypothetical protein
MCRGVASKPQRVLLLTTRAVQMTGTLSRLGHQGGRHRSGARPDETVGLGPIKPARWERVSRTRTARHGIHASMNGSHSLRASRSLVIIVSYALREMGTQYIREFTFIFLERTRVGEGWDMPREEPHRGATRSLVITIRTAGDGGRNTLKSIKRFWRGWEQVKDGRSRGRSGTS